MYIYICLIIYIYLYLLYLMYVYNDYYAVRGPYRSKYFLLEGISHLN